MTESDHEPRWISEYDYPNRTVTLLLAEDTPIQIHWSGIRKDDLLSDPEGDFDVFVAYSADGMRDYRDGSTPIVKIVARLNDEGDLRNPHPDFNPAQIGSLTIWPYKVVGERFGLAHWIWWADGKFFFREPRAWTEAQAD